MMLFSDQYSKALTLFLLILWVSGDAERSLKEFESIFNTVRESLNIIALGCTDAPHECNNNNNNNNVYLENSRRNCLSMSAHQDKMEKIRTVTTALLHT